MFVLQYPVDDVVTASAIFHFRRPGLPWFYSVKVLSCVHEMAQVWMEEVEEVEVKVVIPVVVVGWEEVGSEICW